MMFDRTTFLYYFIIMCVIFIGNVFFLAFKVEALDLGSLSFEKIQTYDDEKYIVSITQEQIFNDTNKYEHIPEYDCGIYKCKVNEYLAPPYTNNDRGYILLMETPEETIIEGTGKLKPYIDKIVATSTYEQIK